MAVELRQWATTVPGYKIPFFKLSLTQAELSYLMDYGSYPPRNDEGFTYHCILYSYNDSYQHFGLAEYYLQELRWIARKTMEGYGRYANYAYSDVKRGTPPQTQRIRYQFPTTTHPNGYGNPELGAEWTLTGNVSREWVNLTTNKGTITKHHSALVLNDWFYQMSPPWGSDEDSSGSAFPHPGANRACAYVLTSDGAITSLEFYMHNGRYKYNAASAAIYPHPAFPLSYSYSLELGIHSALRVEIETVDAGLGYRNREQRGNSSYREFWPYDGNSILSEFIEDYDPNNPDGEDGIVARFNPRVHSSTVGCYLANKDTLRTFLTDLWTTDIIEGIRSAFIGDGSNALLGVRWFYGIKPFIDQSQKMARITLGNVTFQNTTPFQVAVREFVEFDCGSVMASQHYGDHRDWTATNYQLYLPFIGTIDLAPQDVVGKMLYLKYTVNLTDGSAVCNVSTTPSSPNGEGVIFTSTCSWGYDIPVRVEPAMDVMARMAKVTGVGGLITGGGFANPTQYSSGELSPNSNVMSDFQPKLIINRKSDLSGTDFAASEGLPGVGQVEVGDASGYLKASAIYNSGSLAMRRSGEIMAMLQEGIYI